MTDLAAIAAARAAGLAAEADALALADRLVAAKADRARLRADVAVVLRRLDLPLTRRDTADAITP